MTGATQYLEEKVQRWAFLGESFPAAPSSIFVALHSGDPTNSGKLNELNSVQATNYSRFEALVPNEWEVESSGGPYRIQNSTQFEFDEAGTGWPEVTHVSLWDGSSSSDNALYTGAFDDTRTVEDGDIPTFEPESLKIDLE